MFEINNSPPIAEASEHMQRILEAKYKPADLQNITHGCSNLSVT
jgi:hypothetical protein